jgi:hypothetical protein
MTAARSRRGPASLRLSVKPPPAYSPELHPQERLWKWWRRVVTHPHWCPTFREHSEASRHFFRYLAGVNNQVRQ